MGPIPGRIFFLAKHPQGARSLDLKELETGWTARSVPLAQMEHRGARRRRAWPWRARLPFLSACLVCILGTEPAPGGDADRFPCQTHQDCGQSRARRAAVVPRARRDCERMRLRCARRLTGGVELPSPFVLAQATPPFAVRKSAACRKGLQ